ncbi:type I-E CRISPR-associated protein Cas7/Cse4/CasC [Actinopolyspora erythraea]|uniref:CRISPR-associated protein Cse4 n=1 Tax=Actinopolyspora erythraea TaxID=414996 RepID=A0A099D5G3_9ACTN|nr:type I-E CRISPR-associated protein Cas7/Cse4/CasC [Actinopolyspora erythraea]ASU79061.1 type I-E CRISPR-associated protein Cas7/Cse4/CasC [Actinopolyspora erythraea]KGI81186.1 CRISPR-associated protein Cse4 [Actinopolyspora erythraea]
MIVELHLLQSFPTSNLNRDDVGQPKSVTFGGALRGRISSQSMKRSARDSFQRYGLKERETGLRTKRLVEGAGKIIDGVDDVVDVSEKTQATVREGIRKLGFEVDQKDLTEYLLFVGQGARQELADYCQRNWDTLSKAVADRKKSGKTEKVKPTQADLAEGRRILNAERVADVALFGRMVADNKDFNVDAASQVAHAISTHAVATEFDFYTAVDDLKPEEEAGADMIGTVDFNAACYYRYANLDTEQLTKNLGYDTELTARAARAWLHSFITARPSGKQNSMAAHTMPETLLTVVREHGSWNLANAFLNPVRGTELMADSTRAMFEHFDTLRRFYGDEEIRGVTGAALSCEMPVLDPADQAASVEELAERTLTAATR